MRKVARRDAWSLLAIGSFIACSGGGGSIGDGSSSSSGGSPASCRDACARLTTCSQKTEGLCTAANDCGSLIGHLRPEFRDPYLQCIADPATACGKLESCVSTAAAKVPRRGGDDAFTTACNAKRAGCTPSFSDDNCALSFVYTDEAVAKLNACISLACADVGKCLKAALL